jgi:hypothetical protein
VSATWPWALLAGLGIYHGLNPAMGWLFAVALGLHRGSRAVVLASLVPIALGHAAAIALAAAAVVLLGMAIDDAALRGLAGAALILWALYHVFYGRRHRVRVGMRAGFAGLFAWSFVMAGAHGAGPMLMPALIPLCMAAAADGSSAGVPPAVVSALAVGVHTAAMLGVTAIVALLVYDWAGVDFLRRGWFNLDRLWSAALVATGLLLMMPPLVGLW